MKYWGRHYKLTIGIGSQAVTIMPPFRISFNVDKSIKGGINKAKVRIWGLKESTRLSLVKDEQSPDYLPIELMVGYGDNLELLFKGSVRKGEFSREGANFINLLECFDGGVDIVKGFTNTVVKSKHDAIMASLGDMVNTSLGSVSITGDLIRPVVLVGNSSDLITSQLSEDYDFFIDNEQLFVIKNDEVTASYAPLVSASTGLLNTPIINKGVLPFRTMINPSLKLANLCKVESKYNPEINGVYRIEQMTYTGDSKGADWIQVVSGRIVNNVKVVK